MTSSTKPIPKPSELELVRIAVEDIHPNLWNPNRQDAFIYEKELASIRNFGFVLPIVVRGSRRAGWEIVDGEHRWRAAKELGYTELPCWSLGPIPDDTAKQLTIVLNETRGQVQPDLLRPLLADLLERQTAEELLQVLPYTPQTFASLVADFDWNAPEFVDTGPKEQWVLRTFRMPAEAAQILDDAIAKVDASTEWQIL